MQYIKSPNFAWSMWRRWLFITTLVCVVFFGIKQTDAALTSPATVVTGSQYGRAPYDYTLGWRQLINVYPYTTTGSAIESYYPPEHPENRRLLTITPAGSTTPLLLSAFVNTNSSIVGCSGNYPVCRLEFKVSKDGGKTWEQALEGSQPWLPIMGLRYDYTLYLDPNGQDVWVSYTSGNKNIRAYGLDYINTTTSKIKRLIFNTSTNKSWFLTGPEEEPNFGTVCTGSNTCRALTTVGVQMLSNGGRRVWSAIQQLDPSNYVGQATKMAYTEAFGTNATWVNRMALHYQPLLQYGVPNIITEPRLTYISLGTSNIPMLFVEGTYALVLSSLPNQYTGDYHCSEQIQQISMGYLVPRQKYSTTWSTESGSGYENLPNSPYPFFLNSAGRQLDSTSCLGISATTSYPLGYSVASYPISTLGSRVVVAVQGGVDHPYTPRATDIRVYNCRFATNENDASPTTACDNPVSIPDTSNYKLSSVGFTSAGVAQIFATDASSRIVTISEAAAPALTPQRPSLTQTWNWNTAEVQSIAIAGTTKIVGAAEKSASALIVNSDLHPFIWSELGENRIAFSANVGGTKIGPGNSANPFRGYGWSSNFGWLSMNCADRVNGCADAAGVYGVGIGALASATQPPNSTPTASVHISPTSATTFPLGGYAYSPNAGYLSFERADGICTGGSCDVENQYGNPPTYAYSNYATGPDPAVPIAKYDTSTQHVYGWGRFLNLCGYTDLGGVYRCTKKEEGWTQLRGYYLTGATTYTGAMDSLSQLTFSPSNCEGIGNGTVLSALGQYVVVSACYDNADPNVTVTLYSSARFADGTPLQSGITLYDVTSNEFGTDAFWTGDHYELAGWAWSHDYGWIRFNPLIFVGFAWMETLFGNVYSAEGISLPNAEDLSQQQTSTCGESGTEPCYISTYRIETGGAIDGLQFSGTGQTVSAGTSALQGMPADCATPTPLNPEKCRVYPSSDATDLSRRMIEANSLNFPSVSAGSVSYRNALGKLDLGGLVAAWDPGWEMNSVFSNPTRDMTRDKNRFGNYVYQMKTQPSGDRTTYTLMELGGWKNNAWTGTTPVLPLEYLDGQVIHVQGDLIVDGADAKFTSLTNNSGIYSMVVNSASGAFPDAYTFGSGSSVTPISCAGCALVIDQGGDNEEVFSYTQYDSATTTFSEMHLLSSACGVGGCTHLANESVRFVWRLPFNSASTNQKSVTIVVDGNLDIRYNIIAPQVGDWDLLSGSLGSIRNLPTVAFIVKGNVTIDPKVNRITGAYIVTGRDSTKAPGSLLCSSSAALYGNDCGGVFETGDDTSDSALCDAGSKECNPLTITGLLFARQFLLERHGSLEKINKPAEQVNFDERLFLNPPPGLSDVTKALPNPQRTNP